MKDIPIIEGVIRENGDIEFVEIPIYYLDPDDIKRLMMDGGSCCADAVYHYVGFGSSSSRH